MGWDSLVALHSKIACRSLGPLVSQAVELVSSLVVEALSLEGVVRMKRAKANDMNDLGMAHWMEAEVVELLLGKPGNKLAKFPDRRMRA